MKLQESIENLLSKTRLADGRERPFIENRQLRHTLQFLGAISEQQEIEDVFLFKKSEVSAVVFLTKNALIESNASGNICHSLSEIERVEIRQQTRNGEQFELLVNPHKARRDGIVIFKWSASIPSESFMDEHPEQVPAYQEDFEEFKRLASKLFLIAES